MSDELKGGYGDLVWVRDKDGKEYAMFHGGPEGKHQKERGVVRG